VGRNAIVKPDAVVPAGTSTAANKTYG
jgi:hypothetical protein